MTALRNLLLVVVVTVLCLSHKTHSVHGALSESEMRAKLAEYNRDAIKLCNRNAKSHWAVATDVGNKEKQKENEKVSLEHAKFRHAEWEATWKNANINDYQDEAIRRQLFFLKQLGTSALSEQQLTQLTQVVTNMSTIYNSATVCKYSPNIPNGNCKKKLTLDPDIVDRFAHSRDFDELKYYWAKWHDNSGKKIRKDYKNYVGLMNSAANANGYPSAAEWWQSEFEDKNFTQSIDRLWLQVKPLYDDLHTYARYKLIEIYGDKIDRTNPNIPAHLLGNVWAQSWSNLYNDIKPFKNASLVDVTAKLKELNYTAQKLFETSDEFYTSLGLPTNKASFTGESVITKPNDRIIQCHASAWDFCDGSDFRIKMCTNINMEDFVTIHHEMGHIQYYIQYKDLPLALRRGANPGFHEAVGDTIALSVSTPHHLAKIGLIENYADTLEDNVNALFSEALERVAFLPFGLLIDKWRYEVFNGHVKESNWNKYWWSLREQYQKVSSPLPRDEDDFDPGAKYHVPGNSQYISYFISQLLQFQFYKSLCIETGEYQPNNPNTKPLHKCDFYKSSAAGKRLSKGLALGASKHWSEVLKAITGESDLSSSAILEYFKPLQEFLKIQNQRLQREDELRKTLEKYNVRATEQCTKLVTAEWNVNVDVNNDTKHELFQQAVADNAKFAKEQFNLYFSGLNHSDYIDEKIQRQILYLSKLGTDILPENRLKEWSNAKSNMEKIYNNAVFCDYHKPNCDLSTEAITLDPEITEIMAQSTDFDALKYTWTQWYNKSGALMRKDFKKYVEISNEAAKLNGFADYGEMWRSSYEDTDFIENMIALWKQVEPLYDELHKYTRSQLVKIYGKKINESDPLIPAHLLGNMWAQSWVDLYDRIKPFKNAVDIDVTSGLKANKYTALKMFKESDRFYQSLGLASNEMSYTGESVIEKPTDRVIICHASAWDFCDGEDFRIKQCTTVNQRNFNTIHHEMGHIQYFIQYKDQPITFRTGANPGFHEAVGDLMALSVTTPKHLKKINLLPQNYVKDYETKINALLRTALERVAFLPFSLVIDLYRWDIFSGKVSSNEWNSHWEKLRETYQKIRSPVPRTEQHFDAGGKFHVPADTEYIAYFVAHILQFQLYRSLCKDAGQYEPNNPQKPLQDCDIEGSIIAGDKLKAGLSLGLSKHWKKVLEEITGETELRADALLEYFDPLYRYLKEYNENAEKDPYDKVPIIVGIVLGFLLLVITTIYLIYYCKKRTAVDPQTEVN